MACSTAQGRVAHPVLFCRLSNAVKWRTWQLLPRSPDLDHMNVPREINADAAKRLATEKHTPMMQQYLPL